MNPRLLLLIPAYNEAQRIGPVLGAYATLLGQRLPGAYAISVILNGCRDETLQVVREAAQRHPAVRWIEFPDPIGKGGALMQGLRQPHEAEFVGYIDADGATPPEAFWELFEACARGGADAAVGSRWLPGARILRLQSNRRRAASRVFHFIVESLFHLGIRDTQCGAKVFRASAIRAIEPGLYISDMAFDVNLLFLLRKGGFRVLELPTTWTDQSGSKVRLVKVSLSMLLSVVRLRLWHSPFRFLQPLGQPIESWLYRLLR